MNRKVIFIIFLVFVFNVISHSVQAAYIVKNGKLRNVKTTATLPAQEHFDLGIEAMQNTDWPEAQKQFTIVTESFPGSETAQEAYFYLGVAEYNQEEYDFANEAFSNYLKLKNNPKYFQDAIEYKYKIADNLANGSKRRFLGTKRLPKWATGRTLALKIYDEVIAAFPSNELAARALFAKGQLYTQMKDFRTAIENYQMVIRRFPKHELVPESYQAISKIFVAQSQFELQNPDILTFAEMNLKKYKLDFPRDEGVYEVEKDLAQIKEIYAQALYDTAKFYERIDKPHASVIYYQSTIKKFPDADVSKQANERLDTLSSQNEKKQ